MADEDDAFLIECVEQIETNISNAATNVKSTYNNTETNQDDNGSLIETNATISDAITITNDESTHKNTTDIDTVVQDNGSLIECVKQIETNISDTTIITNAESTHQNTTAHIDTVSDYNDNSNAFPREGCGWMWEEYLQFYPSTSLEIEQSNEKTFDVAQDSDLLESTSIINNEDNNNDNNGKIFIFYCRI